MNYRYCWNLYDVFFDFKHNKKLTKRQIDYIKFSTRYHDPMQASIMYYVKCCKSSMSTKNIEKALYRNPDMLELFI